MFFYLLLSILWTYKEPSLEFDLAVREPLCPESCGNPLKRNLFDIIWSCLSTTILCAWTAAHPNVPPRSRWEARWNRSKLMIWMIVIPEMVLVWAVRQFFAAREIRDAYNEARPGLATWKKWTLTHGFMLEMGGFVLVNPEDENKGPDEQSRNSKVLTWDGLQRILRDSEFEFPAVTEADIQDQSKDDAFWIFITILQTSWFIIQSIARGQQHLPPTHLELVTLSLASMNAASFWIWWYKPLGLQEPVRIYQKPNTRDVEPNTSLRDVEPYTRDVDSNTRDVESNTRDVEPNTRDVEYGYEFPPPNYGRVPRVKAVVRYFDQRRFRIPLDLRDLFIIPTYVITFPFFVLFPLGITLFLGIIDEALLSEPVWRFVWFVAPIRKFHFSLSAVIDNVQTWFEWTSEDEARFSSSFLIGWFVLHPLLFVLLFLSTITLSPFIIFAATFGFFTSWTTLRPDASHVPFFYAPSTRSGSWSRVVVITVSGVVVGGLHCIGWNFIYPTRTEQSLWRATSLAIIIVAFECGLINSNSHHVFSYLGTATLLFVYILARLSLVAQAFALLRDLPPSAFVAVDWTQYLPHLFSS